MSRSRTNESPRRSVGHLAALATLAGLAACSATGRPALGLQYVDVKRDAVAGTGLGLALYDLRTDTEEPGWFVDVHAAGAGDVDVRNRAPSGYDGSNDAVRDREVDLVTAHVGPTLRLLDWAHVYAGIGAGYQWETQERFDPTFTVSADGSYRTTANTSLQLSGSFGLLLHPLDGMLVGAGWDTLLEGPVLTLGFTW